MQQSLTFPLMGWDGMKRSHQAVYTDDLLNLAATRERSDDNPSGKRLWSGERSEEIVQRSEKSFVRHSSVPPRYLPPKPSRSFDAMARYQVKLLQRQPRRHHPITAVSHLFPMIAPYIPQDFLLCPLFYAFPAFPW